MSSSLLLEAINGLPDTFHVETQTGLIIMDFTPGKQAVRTFMTTANPIGERLVQDDVVTFAATVGTGEDNYGMLFLVKIADMTSGGSSVVLELIPDQRIDPIKDDGVRGVEFSRHRLPFFQSIFGQVNPIPFTTETK